MKFKGTDSKWAIYGNEAMEIVDEKGKWIADAGVSVEIDYDEKVANAKLIAAAKDLLFACNMAKIEIENGKADQTTIEVLEKAIKKALE